MSSKSPKDSKSYKTAATLFAISGLLFIIVGVVGGKIGIFLPVGIALVIISIVIWQHSKKLTDNERKDSSK
jgi:membrane-bound ClpP family serine protease